MTQHFNGSTDMAYFTAMPFGGIGAFCITAWLWRDDNTQTPRPIFEYGQNIGFDLIANSGGGNDLIRSYTTSPAGSWQDTYVSPAAGAWHHYLWIIPCNFYGDPPPAKGNNQVWIDGVKQTLTAGTHTHAGNPSGTDLFSIMGRRVGTTNSLFYGGKLAEFAICASDACISNPSPFANELFNGASVIEVFHDGMIQYLPLFGDNPIVDWHGSQRNLTVVGTPATQPHPPKAVSQLAFSV